MLNWCEYIVAPITYDWKWREKRGTKFAEERYLTIVPRYPVEVTRKSRELTWTRELFYEEIVTNALS